MALVADTSNACIHFRTDWLTALATQGGEVIMASPRVVSTGGGTLETLENFDDAACPFRKIRRIRRNAITIQYTPLELWPFGASAFMTLKDAPAVCAQHALEALEGLVTCASP